jgi:ankyrin repeat protein
MTPLHSVIEIHFDDIALLLLKQSTIHVNLKNKDGNTPLHMLAVSKLDKTIEIAAALLSMGANINEKNNEGDTPMHIAVGTIVKRKGNISLLQFLSERGADAYITNNKGETPLSLATKNGQYGIADILQTPPSSPSLARSSSRSSLNSSNSSLSFDSDFDDTPKQKSQEMGLKPEKKEKKEKRGMLARLRKGAKTMNEKSLLQLAKLKE